jgi:type VI secretion system secreted protein VgrG
MPLAVLSFDSGDTSLSVRSFRVEDAVSRPFTASVTAVSPNQIDLETIVGRGAALALDAGFAGGRHDTRRWGGVCQHIEQVKAEPTGLSTYELRIKPTLWLLTQRRGYRVFQHLSIPDIVDRVLSPYAITPTWQIDRGRYSKLWYKLQYGESDYAFFCRLLEEAGIAFTFVSSDASGAAGAAGGVAAGTQLVIGDALEKAAPRTPALTWTDNPNTAVKQEQVTELHLSHEVRPGAYTIRDFDFRRPAFGLSGEADRAPAPETELEQYRYEPGAFLIETSRSAAVPPAGDTPAADDKAIARYDDKLGADRASRALAGARMGRRAVTLRTSILDLGTGAVFSVSGHPHAELASGANLLVVEQTAEGTIDGEWTMRVRAVFTDVPYRPPLVTPKPTVDGVQSATVVGPSDQEIHTDEFGRVRIQFPWDREGGNDDNSSCWVRVSQGWAGTGFGLVNLPRVGQEVLVGFLEGDPDQPIVVGRVFNAQNLVPYPLPEHRTRSTWKSRSSPGGGGFNEIMFEDLAARELFWMQAEKDLRKLVKNDETITVGRDRQKLVKRNETEVVNVNRTEVTLQDRTEITRKDRTTVIHGNREELVKRDAVLRVEGNRVIYVGGDQHLMVMGTKRERVERDRHVLVRGNRNEQVGGNYGLTAGSHQIVCGNQAVGAGTIHLKAASKIVIEAPDVTLKAAGGFVHIHGGGVEIKGATVKINSGGSAGSLGTGGGGDPEKPLEAKVEEPKAPTPDDVSVTLLGPGR